MLLIFLQGEDRIKTALVARAAAMAT